MIKDFFSSKNNLYNRNKDDVKLYNQKIIKAAFLVSFFILFLVLISSFFIDSIRETRPFYFITFLMITLLFFLFEYTKLKENLYIFIYLFQLVWFILVLYLSVYRFNLRPAGTALTFFVVAPLLFLDKNYHTNIFTTLLYVIHLVLSFVLKGSTLGLIDLINTTASVLVGIFVGRFFLISRLNNFEMERLLRKEKETDFLTGLYNRRKLYDDLNNLDSKLSTSFMMIDLDNFKEYNDKHGHLSGDKLIQDFSTLLVSKSKGYDITFYRYGGDEFSAIVGDLSKELLLKVAKEINANTKKIETFDEKITSSIGIYIKDGKVSDSNLMLDLADKALYQAKNKGKDKVYIYNEENQ